MRRFEGLHYALLEEGRELLGRVAGELRA
eukprot:COSAG01_NODE_48018_length_384_cov_59.656140_1_plen_28_part_01